MIIRCRPQPKASARYPMMKMRGRFTGAVAATMRQQFACSAFRSGTSFLFSGIGNAAFGADIPRKRGGSDKCGVACVPARFFLAKDNGVLYLTRKD